MNDLTTALLALGIALAVQRRFFPFANVQGLNHAIGEARRNPARYNIVCMGCYARCSHDHADADEARRCERLTATTEDTTFGPFSWCRCRT